MPAEFQFNVASVFVDEYPYDMVNYRALTESHPTSNARINLRLTRVNRAYWANRKNGCINKATIKLFRVHCLNPKF